MACKKTFMEFEKRYFYAVLWNSSKREKLNHFGRKRNDLFTCKKKTEPTIFNELHFSWSHKTQLDEK